MPTVLFINPYHEVLTAFVRGHAPWPPHPDSAYGPDTPIDGLPELQVRAVDVQAAMTVLGRRPQGHQSGRLDLHSVDLRNANLVGAQLQRADLGGAQLQGADLSGAQLQGADLSGAQLQHAYLVVADSRPEDEVA
jgi:hypothetical protein